MNKLLAVLLAGAVALVALAAVVGAFTPAPFDPVAYERQQIAIERARAIAPLETFAAGVLALVPAALAVLALLLLAAWGSAALIRFHYERRPDGRGLLPVGVGQLYEVSPRALGAFHAARQIEAGRQLVPHTLTYSPHNAPRIDYRADSGGAALLPADDAPALGNVPTFAQLLDAGRIGRGNPLLLGYDAEGKPVEGSWLQLYSTAVGGLSGSGKSWTATFLAAQAALYGARIVLLDPHAADEQSLARRLAPMRSRFICEVASEPGTMRAAVELVAGELARRKVGKRGEPWLFIADEFTALQRGALAEPLSALVEALGQEGRKLGLYGMVCGQVWSAARAGGSELRDSLASAYVHRLRPAQARMLTGLGSDELPGDLLQLPAGSAYLLDTSGDLRRVTIPLMRPADVERVAGLLEGPAPSEAASEAPSRSRPFGFRPARVEGASEGTLEAALPAHQEAGTWTPEEAAILAALQAGKTPGEVAAELAGTTSGRRYQEAARRVADIISRALGGGR